MLTLIGLLLHSTSCTHPQLIENLELNQERIYDVVERASAVSNMRVMHPLSVKLIPRAEVAKILQESAAATAHSRDWTDWHAGRSAMGFSSEPKNATSERVVLLSRTATGLYVSQRKILYIVSQQAQSARGGIYLDSLGTIGQEVTLAHEVIHALQHQHYPKLFEPDEVIWLQQNDASLALQAAKEGDATLWAAQSLGFLGRAKDPEDVLKAAQDGIGSFSDAPPLIREQTLFPYTYGYRFAYHEGRLGLESPPASTEQIIHPESQRRRDFQAINLAEFARSIEAEGCRVLDQDTMGELTLSLWLRTLDSTVPQDVWDGWDGDRWIAADCKTEREIAWVTSWDTEKDASEFEKAIIELAPTLQMRANLQTISTDRQGTEVIVTSKGLASTASNLKRVAIRARVTTRAELAAHFSKSN